MSRIICKKITVLKDEGKIMTLYASWVHGTQVQLERGHAVQATSKSTVNSAFHRSNGDLVYLGGSGRAACLRLGWAARFVVYDCGNKNYAKSGSFWCHYAIPTPVIEDGTRAQADTVLINYESSNINALSIGAIHVWDGNKRIFADNSPTISSNDFNGGIPGHSTNAGATPRTNELWRGDIQNRPIYFGLCVSLRINAQRAKDDYLEIRSVGIDFQI